MVDITDKDVKNAGKEMWGYIEEDLSGVND